MNQKGFVGILVLIVVVIAAVAGGVYYLGTRITVTPVPSPTPVVTSQTPQPILFLVLEKSIKW